jgi:hypothetical protein
MTETCTNREWGTLAPLNQAQFIVLISTRKERLSDYSGHLRRRINPEIAPQGQVTVTSGYIRSPELCLAVEARFKRNCERGD